MSEQSKFHKKLWAYKAAIELITGEPESLVRARLFSESIEAGLRPDIAEAFANETIQAALEKRAEFQAHVREFWKDLIQDDSDEEEAG